MSFSWKRVALPAAATTSILAPNSMAPAVMGLAVDGHMAGAPVRVVIRDNAAPPAPNTPLHKFTNVSVASECGRMAYADRDFGVQMEIPSSNDFFLEEYQ